MRVCEEADYSGSESNVNEPEHAQIVYYYPHLPADSVAVRRKIDQLNRLLAEDEALMYILVSESESVEQQKEVNDRLEQLNEQFESLVREVVQARLADEESLSTVTTSSSATASAAYSSSASSSSSRRVTTRSRSRRASASGQQLLCKLNPLLLNFRYL